VKQFIRRLVRTYSVFFVLLGIMLVLGLLSPRFLTYNNLMNILEQSSILGIAAIGVTFTIIAGGIDLSVGSVIALCGALSAGFIVRSGIPAGPAILLAIAAGGGIGAVNGGLIIRGRVQPFVTTLAMMAIARGLTLIYTQGRPISGMGDAYVFIGSGDIGFLPVPALIFVGVVVLTFWILTRTAFGIQVYAVGGNEETARLAGIKVNRVKMATYVISGMCAALAGVILAARLWSAQPQAASGLELRAIAATVLGGTSLMGGAGGTPGTFAGALLMGVLSNGLNLIGVSSYLQQVIIGAIFILAVTLDMYTKRQSADK